VAGAGPTGTAVLVFISFAAAYFLSALLRAVTATLAPLFSAELGIGAADLGLLAGAYFVGFAMMQLPLGRALDSFGPKRVLLVLLVIAVVGCGAFAQSTTLATLLAARTLIGVGVAACLMAPLTSYRHSFSPAGQMRANSWMLMTGSLGMIASTLPVQWLLPKLGWRGLFWLIAGLLLAAAALIAMCVRRDASHAAERMPARGGYRTIVRHPLFVRLAPMGLFCYGGLIAVQALWAGPWLTRLAQWSPERAAEGLFVINCCMGVTFLCWGAALPRLVARGMSGEVLMAWGMPVSLLSLAANLWLGPQATALHWALWCVLMSLVTLSQPTVGQAMPVAQAGRALSAFNLVVFCGVFVLQWGIGLVIDALRSRGFSDSDSFRVAFGVFGACCLLSYLWYLRGFVRANHNRR
jgi:MFS family permease